MDRPCQNSLGLEWSRPGEVCRAGHDLLLPVSCVIADEHLVRGRVTLTVHIYGPGLVEAVNCK